MKMIKTILIQQIYCILFIVFLLTTSLVLANQYSQEDLNAMKEYMKENKPAYQGKIYNIREPVKLEYNPPRQFTLTTNTFGPQEQNEYSNRFLIRTEKLDQHEIANFIQEYKEAEIKRIPIPKFEMTYEFNSQQTIWTWWGFLCEAAKLYQQMDCSANYNLFLDFPGDTIKFKKLISQHGDEISFLGLSLFDQDTRKWEILHDEYAGDWGKMYSSLTSLTTPIITTSSNWYGKKSKKSQLYQQGEILYKYPLRYLFHYALAAGLSIDGLVDDLDGIILGKTIYNNRESLLIGLEKSESFVALEVKDKFFFVEGFQIVDIETGLISYSNINIFFNHFQLDDPQKFFPVIAFFERSINF